MFTLETSDSVDLFQSKRSDLELFQNEHFVLEPCQLVTIVTNNCTKLEQ